MQKKITLEITIALSQDKVLWLTLNIETVTTRFYHWRAGGSMGDCIGYELHRVVEFWRIRLFQWPQSAYVRYRHTWPITAAVCLLKSPEPTI